MYKKKLLSEDGSKYQIILYYDDGRTQNVSTTQDLFEKWLEAGNTPEVIAYVAPTPQPPHIPPVRQISRLLVVDRIIEAGLRDDAIALIKANPSNEMRWYAAPENIKIDDTDLNALLVAIGADVDTILTPEETA